MLNPLQRVSNDSTVTMLAMAAGAMPTAEYPNPPLLMRYFKHFT